MREDINDKKRKRERGKDRARDVETARIRNDEYVEIIAILLGRNK